MPTYEYSATAIDGQVTSGRVFGTSMEKAMADLQSKGLSVQSIGVAGGNDPLAVAIRPAVKVEQAQSTEAAHENVHDIPLPRGIEGPSTEQRSYLATSIWGPLIGKVPLARLLFFFRQFATMSGAGVPIVQSLTTLAGQARNEKLTAIVLEIRGHVEAGRPVSVGMQRYPEVFSPIMMSLVRAGETAGFFDEALNQVADYIEREIELRNLYRRVTFNPKLTIVASIIIILVTNVILGSLNTNTRLSSPLTTVTTWLWLGPLIIGLFLFFRVGLANGRIKYNWDLIIASIPGFKTIIRELAMAKFGRAFGALYKAGVPVHQALPMAADACGNEYLRSKMYPAARQLEAGHGMTETFKATGAFSPIVLDMVSTGEKTGNVDQMLAKMAQFYEEEAATKSTQVGLTFGVVVFLCVAVYIGMIVINFYSGYFGGIMKNA